MLEEKIAYEDRTIRVYLSNKDGVTGATAIFEHKSSRQFAIIDFGVGFTSMHEDAVNKTDETEKYLDLLRTGTKRHLLLSHAHRDHFCDIGHFIKAFPNDKYYMSLFSQLIVKRDFEDNNFQPNILDQSGSFTAGIFEVKYGPTVHSIPGTRSFVLEYPLANLTGRGKILFLAEARINESSFTPGLSQKMKDFILANRPYDMVFMDGLRHAEKGYTEPEDTIRKPLQKILEFIPGDLYIPYISSKMALTYCLMDELKKLGYGYSAKGISMEDMLTIGRENQLLPSWKFDPRNSAKKIVFSVTGSQCEPSSFMDKITSNDRGKNELLLNDFLFVAQGSIPHYLKGNRKMYEAFAAQVPQGGIIIGRSEQNRLKLRSTNVFILEDMTGEKFDLSSGHGKSGDQKELEELASAKITFKYQMQKEEESAPESGTVESDNPQSLVDMARDFFKNSHKSKI